MLELQEDLTTWQLHVSALQQCVHHITSSWVLAVYFEIDHILNHWHPSLLFVFKDGHILEWLTASRESERSLVPVSRITSNAQSCWISSLVYSPSKSFLHAEFGCCATITDEASAERKERADIGRFGILESYFQKARWCFKGEIFELRPASLHPTDIHICIRIPKT